MDDNSATAPFGNRTDSMSDDFDQIFGGLLRELEAASDRSAVVDRCCARHPMYASEIRQTIATMDLVRSSCNQSDGEIPKRLGDFGIIRRLARGGMGDIFEAVQEPLGRRVAVKTIRDDRLAASPEVHDRFLREQTVLARLHHTHIVPIHAAGQEGRLHYFAMPYIEGAALSHLVESARDLGSRRGSTPTLAELAALLSTARSGPCPSTNSDTASRLPGETSRVAAALSLAYFRSVARVLADAADAVQHAHDAHVLHRDLKPSNLMVDRHEHCWVLDFGLARFRGGHATDAFSPTEADTAASGRMGTPLYMAPEQFELRADERTDVWGLGVTLYELLTLHRAFASPSQVQNADPAPPRSHVLNLPRDMEAICLKALRKDPTHRYQSPRAMADDLRHWLDHEPTSVRPARVVRRIGLWSRRNRGWAAAILLAVVAVVGAGVSGALFYKWRADADRQVAAAAKAGELDQRRESLLEQLVRIRLTPHTAGWSSPSQAWGLVGQAAMIRRDDRLKSQAAATLMGLDATQIKEFHDGATALSFDRDGKRLLIGGGGKGLLLWDYATDLTERQDQDLDGPFATRSDGTAVQLGTTPRKADQERGIGFPLRIWNVTAQKLDRTFADPSEGGSIGVAAFAISPDAARVGASVMLPDQKRVLVVWDSDSGEILREIDYPAFDLAFAPDPNLLAAWDDAGHIDLWSLSDGERLATLSSGSNPVHAVAFGPNHWRRGETSTPAGRWLLAAGEVGGTITIWDLHLKIPRAICRGSQYDVLALAFSPDGSTLATAGRSRAKLWDVATGQSLLDLIEGNVVTALAFTPAGDKLAVASLPAFGSPGVVHLWELEDGRGIRTLRGLTAQAEKAVFSRDGHRVAGLSQDWRVAIWDRETAQLRRMLDVPRGDWADNSGLAFSPDGRRFAFSAGRQAKLWDIETGRVLGRWDLPPGFQDTLVFPDQDRLLLLRTETKDGRVRPYGPGSDPRDHPRVCPLRELRAGNTAETIAIITDFNWHLHDTRASSDGKYFLLEGLGGPEGKTRTVNSYDSSGKRLWVLPSQKPLGHASWMRFDPTGKVFFLSNSPGPITLHEMPTRALLASFDEKGVWCLGPGGTRWAGGSGPEDQPFGIWIAERGREDRLIKILTTLPGASTHAEFGPDGRHLAWGNPDGTVTFCDLAEIQRRLAGVGMGW